ncbi:MAG: hypothetical protein SNJ59_03900 [Aggregatilineales bacterium]
MFTRLQRGAVSMIPNLVVAQRVLDKMRAAAESHLQDETGEALVGLYLPGTYGGGLPTLYVLDTISPDDSAVRQFHTFQQGDARQDELIWWMQENWQVTRERRTSLFGKNKWDVPLRYLGDWHKQPGFMIQPSGGDLMTALDWIEDPENRTDFLLTPIVTLGHPATISISGVTTNFIMLPCDGEAMRIDWWYIDRTTRGFAPIAPVVYPDGQLPELAPYPWHLVNEARIEQELSRLDDDGLFHSITLWKAQPEPPLAICFLTARMGSDRMLILVTPHDYPAQPPSVRAAPFVHMGPDEDMYQVFANAWKKSQPVELDEVLLKNWTAERYLIDLVHAAERKLGLRSAPTQLTGAATSEAERDEEETR